MFTYLDVIDDGEKLVTFENDSVDFVIANHFLEHTEDPIGTLKNFLRVLRPGGKIFMAIPDMRFTFDKNRARTPLAHLIRDHEQGGESSRREHYREWVTLVEPHFGRQYKEEDEIQTRL